MRKGVIGLSFRKIVLYAISAAIISLVLSSTDVGKLIPLEDHLAAAGLALGVTSAIFGIVKVVA